MARMALLSLMDGPQGLLRPVPGMRHDRYEMCRVLLFKELQIRRGDGSCQRENKNNKINKINKIKFLASSG